MDEEEEKNKQTREFSVPCRLGQTSSFFSKHFFLLTFLKLFRRFRKKSMKNEKGKQFTAQFGEDFQLRLCSLQAKVSVFLL